MGNRGNSYTDNNLGTVTVDTSGLSTSDNQTNGSQKTQVTNFPASTEISNDAGNPIPVSGTVTANTGLSQPLTDTQLRASNIGVTVSNFPSTQAVSATSLPLPTGASTSANQTTANSSLSSIDSKLTNVATTTNQATTNSLLTDIKGFFTNTYNQVTNWFAVKVINTVTVDGSGVTQPISAASLPLPTGAATETTLSGLNTKVTTTANGIKVDGSAVTQPISGTVTANQGGTWNVTNISGTVSLPTGASTSANQTTANSSLSSIDTKLSSQATATNQTTTNTNLTNIYTRQTDGNQKSQIVNGSNVLAVNSNGSASVAGTSAVGVAPANPPVSVSGVDGGGLKRALLTDTGGRTESNAGGNLETGSYPDPSVTDTGIKQNIAIDQYGNIRTRGEVLTDELSFRDDFSNGGADAAWIQTVSSGSIAFSNSKLTLGSGTANASNPSMVYVSDYCPITARFNLSLSQRIANQTFNIGFITRSGGSIISAAYLQFSGTNNQKVTTITQSSSDSVNDVETNSNVTIPTGLTTASILYYKIDVSNNTVTFTVSSDGNNYYPLSQHRLHIPSPYQGLNFEVSALNAAVVTNTNLVMDYVFLNNMDRIQIDQDFQGEPLPAQLIGQVGNVYKNVNATPTGELKVEIGGNNLSAFGDLNTAELTPLIQIDFVYGILTSLGTTTVANSATATTSAARLQLTSGTNSAGSAIYQTTKVAKYRPAQGIDARFTYVFDTGIANCTQEVGMGDTTNGYFFGYVGTSFGIIYRNGGSQTFIAQSSWNVDPCDGTVQTSFTLNPQFGNAYKVKYPYQGYANIKFFVFNPNTGNYILVHQIQYANTSASVQLSNPNLTFWARIINSGNTTSKTNYVGSVGVFLSGRKKYLGQSNYSYNNKALTAAGGLTSLFTLKNCTTFNTVANKSLARITSISLSSGNLGNNAFGYLFLIKNATLGGTPAYAAENGTTADGGVTITNGQSPISIDTAGTTVTGGTGVWGTNGIQNSNAFLDISQEDIFIAPGETLTIAGLVTANASLSAVLNKILDI